MARKIIIDTDPGTDDAVALLLALAAPDELEVLGVVAVAGNLPLARTENNARRLCALAGRGDIPVFAGCAGPLLGPPFTAEYMHGESGLGTLELPEPEVPLQTGHGIDFLIETILGAAAGEEVTLCTLGPLTDVAVALAKAPQIAPRLREIVVMGGARAELGNITPAAEFNIHADPHAAAAVFASGVPLVVVSLDATHKVRSSPERIARLRALGNRCGAAVATLLGPPAGLSPRYGAAPPLHDPCVVASLLRPELFAGRLVNVAVETASPLTRGMTVVDWWGVTARPPNARFLDEADGEGFYELLTERIARLP